MYTRNINSSKAISYKNTLKKEDRSHKVTPGISRIVFHEFFPLHLNFVNLPGMSERKQRKVFRKETSKTVKKVPLSAEKGTLNLLKSKKSKF